VISVRKATIRNKSQRKRNHAPQTDLLGNILLPPNQDVDFPGLSNISKYADNGVSYPEIPIVEIQKTVVETCRVAPLEVIAELLLASRPEDEASPSKSGVTNDHNP
jgi:hypothetical protein